MVPTLGTLMSSNVLSQIEIRALDRSVSAATIIINSTIFFEERKNLIKSKNRFNLLPSNV